MGTYVANTDISAAIGGRTIDANSTPNLTQVGEWIDQLEAEATAVMAACNIAAPAAVSDGGNIIKRKVIAGTAGLVQISHAYAGGDGTNDSGQQSLEEWKAWITDIRNNADDWKKILEGSSSASDSFLRTYHIDNTDSLSVGDGNFAARITKDEEF